MLGDEVLLAFRLIFIETIKKKVTKMKMIDY